MSFVRKQNDRRHPFISESPKQQSNENKLALPYNKCSLLQANNPRTETQILYFKISLSLQEAANEKEAQNHKCLGLFRLFLWYYMDIRGDNVFSNQQQRDLKKRARFKKLNLAINAYVELLFLSIPLIHLFKWLGSLALHLVY